MLIKDCIRRRTLPFPQQQSTALTACDPTKATADERMGSTNGFPSPGQRSLRGNHQISPISIRSGPAGAQSAGNWLCRSAEFLPSGNRGLPQRQVQGGCRESPTIGADHGRSTKTVQERQANHADS